MNSYCGQIVLFASVYDPEGWLTCDGRLLYVNEYSELFAVIYNKFGGNGVTTFALPNLVARLPMGAGTSATGGHAGSNSLGATGGTVSFTKLATVGLPIPPAADAVSVVSGSTPVSFFAGAFAALRYCICVDGEFPSRG